MAEVLEKEKLFRKLLIHKHIKEVRGRGLMLAAITENADITNQAILQSKAAGALFFWLLFEPNAIRITPPLTISFDEIEKGCQILINVLNKI
jgi:acetylornithine aminotransferase